MKDTTEKGTSGQEQRISVNTNFELSELIVGSDGRSVPLDQEVVRIGGKIGNDVVLKDGDIASFHCEVWRQRDHHVLVNRASNQHTFLNGQPVEFRLLKPGDRIQVGEVQIKVVSKSEGDDSDAISPDDVENLFQEEKESDDREPIGNQKLSEIKSNAPSGRRRQKTTSSGTAVGRSSGKKGLVLQILLGLAAVVVVLLSIEHFFG